MKKLSKKMWGFIIIGALLITGGVFYLTTSNNTDSNDHGVVTQPDPDENHSVGDDPSNENQPSTDTGKKPVVNPPSKKPEPSISFPFYAKNDHLVIEGIRDYSGYYIEDGSETEVENISVIYVKNTSDQVMEYCEIYLNANGETLTFAVSLLPPNESAIVMEANKKGISADASFTYGGSKVAYLNKLELSEDQVKVSTKGNAVTLKNISDSDIKELRVFYKNQFDSGEFLGGIAYTIKIEDLKANEEKTVYPSHFDSDYGMIMMVRVYE